MALTSRSLYRRRAPVALAALPALAVLTTSSTDTVRPVVSVEDRRNDDVYDTLAVAVHTEAAYQADRTRLAARAATLERAELSAAIDGWLAARRTAEGAHAWARAREAAAMVRAAQTLLAADLEALVAKRRSALHALAAAVVEHPADPTAADRLAAAWMEAVPPALTIVFSALAELGAPYRFGATGPGSFDCSGLTRHVFAELAALPHKAAFQFDVLGPAPTPSPQVGDLVFFAGGSTAAGPYDIGHVAIAIGAGWVVHASAAAGEVAVDLLDDLRQPVGHASVLDAENITAGHVQSRVSNERVAAPPPLAVYGTTPSW